MGQPQVCTIPYNIMGLSHNYKVHLELRLMALLETSGDAIGVWIPWPCWRLNSTTKALAHVLRLLGSNIHHCPGTIFKFYTLGYRDHYHRQRLSDGLLCQQKKAVVSDSIDNIQERMSIVMWTSTNANRTVLSVQVYLFLSPMLICKTIILT